MIRAILTDIEVTTSSLSFVKDVLFPYACERLPAFVQKHAGEPAVRKLQQRYYDAGIGRFLPVDPVTAYEKPGQNFNRYWYANDNPYKFTDPNGRVAIITQMKDGSVLIQFPTKFMGPAASPANVAAAQEHVAGMSGTYSINGKETSFKVEATGVKEAAGVRKGLFVLRFPTHVGVLCLGGLFKVAMEPLQAKEKLSYD